MSQVLIATHSTLAEGFAQAVRFFKPDADNVHFLNGYVASTEFERELREGVAPEDCEGAFICASAWLAAAALTDARLGGAEELSSLRAGDVTIEVRGGANSERAAALRRSARQLMAPYTEGGGFFFCAVKG